MSGANNPQQMVFDPIPPQLKPLLGTLATMMQGQLKGGAPPGVPMGGLPPAGAIFQQLFGGMQQPGMGGMQGGAGGDAFTSGAPTGPRPKPIASGSRSIRSAPGGNIPSFGQMFLRQRGY